jgi:glutathione peroxidase-family protein
MNGNNFAMPMYKATNEQNQMKLFAILKKHIPTLREYELIKDNPAYILQSEDGTIIETFEWKDEKAKMAAHEHPAIRTIWGEMEGICTFPALRDLPESKTRFPNFKILEKC